MASFEQFYNSTVSVVYYKVLSYVKNEEIAKDITQDVYFDFYKNMQSVYNDTACLQFLFIIAKNKSLDYLKHYKDNVEYNDNILSNLYKSQDDIDNIDLIIKIIKDKIKIKSQDIDLILLHVVNDYTFDEISLMLDMKLNTCMTRYNRAMKKIRSFFNKKGGF